MYSPSYYIEKQRDKILDIIQEYNFAILMTNGSSIPDVTHLPFLLERTPSGIGKVIGHCARANPIWKSFENQEVLITFLGPHAYISPSWYEPDPQNVPTWNYAVVHVRGRALIIEDTESKLFCLQQLVKYHENKYGTGWELNPNMTASDPMLSQIVVFEVPLDNVEAKFKMNQQHSENNKKGVVEGLSKLDLEYAKKLSKLMAKQSLN